MAHYLPVIQLTKFSNNYCLQMLLAPQSHYDGLEMSLVCVHFIGHFWDDFYRQDDPTNSLKALKEASWPLR